MPITVIPDTGVNQIHVNYDSGRNIILSGFSAGSVPHNYLNGLQGGQSNQYYHLTSGEYANLVTGSVVRPSETGQFYPASNPSGFITGVDTGSYATVSFVTGVSGSLQAQINNISVTGDYYPNNNPSGYITGVDLSGYSTISFSTGISGHLQGQISVLNNNTGSYYLNSNPSGYITGIDQRAFLTLIPTGVEETGIAFPYTFSSVPRVFANFALYSDTGYLVGVKNVATTGYTAIFSDLIEETGLYLQTLATNL